VGKLGAVAVATNAAEHGTNIEPNQAALHAIIGFLSAALSVEVQALRRAGRQGQCGSCENLFAAAEDFTESIRITASEEVGALYARLVHFGRGYTNEARGM
jgi:preprotein translocase subunit SecA